MNRWAVAWRNVQRNRRRSLLTGGIIVFGYVAIVLAGGFMAQSFEGLRDNAIHSGLGHLQFADPRLFERNEENTLEFGLHEAKRITASLSKHALVKVVMPRVEFFGLVSTGARSVPFLGVGVDPEAEAQGADIPKAIAAGAWLKPGEHGAVLGGGLARTLGVRVGDSITLLATTPDGVLNAVDANIVGIAQVFAKELDDRYLAIPTDLAQLLLNAPGVVSKISVILHADTDVDTARTQLLAELSYTPQIDAKTWEQLAGFYHQVKHLYIGIFGFMGLILIVVVFLATVNTVLMTVTERTREIGSLRAMGARPQYLAGNFVIEGVLLGVAGCVLGTLLAAGISLTLNASGIMLPPPPGSTRGFPIHIQFFPLAYGIAMFIMISTLALASYFPARRATRRPIVESLAHV